MILTVQCKDQVGLVASISGILSKENINILSMREHVDLEQNLFFARIEIQDGTDAKKLQIRLKQALPHDAKVTANDHLEKKIIVLVSKEHHCLSDILSRNHFRTLGAKVQCVIGNHEILSEICKRFEVPFHYISHDDKSKGEFEQELHLAIASYQNDCIVLAKFMRILSREFVSKYPLKILNIHHSFLPAFIGANPYKQAYERGVKFIGATAHFVTDELDDGPIIAQQIIAVNHSFYAKDLMSAGREVETAVLAKAMQLVFTERVFVYNNKTVVFE